jgi:dipeptidase
MPDAVGGVMWFGTDDANMVVFTPVYGCATVVPDCYKECYADPLEFSWKSSFWVFNWVSNMIYPKYSMIIEDMRKVQGALENGIYEQSKEVEAEAIAVIGTSPKYAIELLTDFTCNSAEMALAEWKKFGEKIIVKYNDYTVKSEKNGKLDRGTTGLGGKLNRPGYPQGYLKRIVEETGDRYLIPSAK